MFSSFRDRFGTAGLVVAITALVVALVGTAYAASKLNPTQKKEVEKIAKKFAGKNGAPGAQGPAGTNGTNGKDGANGTNGKDGANGKSVVVGAATAGECPKSKPVGGATVEVAGEPSTKKKICNGEEGSPWTAGGTLPEGATETGAWAAAGTANAAVMSFAIPLAAPLDENHVHYSTDANFADFDGAGPGTEGCEGSVENPTAPEGHLCVYKGVESQIVFQLGILDAATGAAGAAKTGAYKLFFGETALALARGTWAVTGF